MKVSVDQGPCHFSADCILFVDSDRKRVSGCFLHPTEAFSEPIGERIQKAAKVPIHGKGTIPY